MKSKIFKYLSIILILFTCFFLLLKQNEIKADSGWDTSYDSGSSWDRVVSGIAVVPGMVIVAVMVILFLSLFL